MIAFLVELLGDVDVPTHPVYGVVNAILNAATLVVVALIYSHRK